MKLGAVDWQRLHRVDWRGAKWGRGAAAGGGRAGEAGEKGGCVLCAVPGKERVLTCEENVADVGVDDVVDVALADGLELRRAGG